MHLVAKQHIFEEALKVPEGEGLEVAEALYESLAEPADRDVEQAWVEQIKRRVDDLAMGRVKTIPWDEARKRIV